MKLMSPSSGVISTSLGPISARSRLTLPAVSRLLRWPTTAANELNCSSAPTSGLEMSTAITVTAPSSLAMPTGRLAAMPPSTRARPSSRTGGKAPGIDMLARMAVARLPESRTTASPVAMSAATAR